MQTKTKDPELKTVKKVKNTINKMETDIGMDIKYMIL